MTPLGSSRLLDPSTLSGIRDLQLLARTVVEGFLSGLHLDRRPGVGAEFSQYRSYQPGDDPRRVDWRVFARSDRYYVRESEVERDVAVRFLLDASASMAHADGSRTRFDYARFLVAALAYLVDRQGDRLAFNAAHAGSTVDLEERVRQRSLLRLLHLLERIEPAGRWPAWRLLGGRVARERGHELVVVVSDLHDEGGEILEALAHLKTLGREVLVLHLMTRDELEFPHSGDLLFEDMETGRTVRANADALRASYLARLEEDLAAWRRRLLDLGVAYELVPTDRPLDQALRSFLIRRRQLA